MTDVYRDVYRDDPPPLRQRVHALYVWIAVYADGSEGIVSADVPFEATVRHMPLMSSQHATAAALRPVAERIRAEALRQAGRDMHVELRQFRLVADQPPQPPWSDEQT
jgi:hypothetical protein